MMGSRRIILGSDDIMDKEKMFKKKKVCQENRNVGMRKVRIIYNDPDATDSSSDDESNDEKNEYGERVKRIVREVYIPMDNSSEGSPLSVRVEGPKKIKGVRRREGGKFAAEIRDPIQKKKVWIGTYATEGEAHEAYRIREAELNRAMVALNKKNFNAASSCASEKTTELCSGPSLDVVDNVQDSTKDTMRLMDELVLKGELSNAGLEENPCDDSREPTVKKLRDDHPFASLTNFDALVFNYQEELSQQQLLENCPALGRPEPDFELGKEEIDWFNSL